MEKKFKRKETDKPLTDLGKPKSTPRDPKLNADTIKEKVNKK